jgi:hypothetical protein
VKKKGTQIEKLNSTDSNQKKKKNASEGSLREQYELIKDDIVKLSNDLRKGYDMAKNIVEKKEILDQLLKFK